MDWAALDIRSRTRALPPTQQAPDQAYSEVLARKTKEQSLGSPRGHQALVASAEPISPAGGTQGLESRSEQRHHCHVWPIWSSSGQLGVFSNPASWEGQISDCLQESQRPHNEDVRKRTRIPKSLPEPPAGSQHLSPALTASVLCFPGFFEDTSITLPADSSPRPWENPEAHSPKRVVPKPPIPYHCPWQTSLGASLSPERSQESLSPTPRVGI